ncbi:hypothetical protein GGR19_002733 [Croceicoccus naphthovorans]|nr:hypothetical protein [Croceicoccus naphthovorans]
MNFAQTYWRELLVTAFGLAVAALIFNAGTLS